MSGAALAAVSGVGYGVFQSFNRRAVGGLQGIYLGTFLQLVIALVVLVAADAVTGDFAVLAHATAAGVLWFLAAGVVHFFCGWSCLNVSQARIGVVLAPLLVGRHVERVTAPVWSGAGAVIGGSLLLVVDGS